MKKALIGFFLIATSMIICSCAKETVKPDNNKVNHVGEKWNIVSVDYTLVDTHLINPVSVVQKTGTAQNAGAFYYDGTQGSFDITIEGYHKEDIFGFQESASGITIVQIAQSVSTSSFSQFVIAFSGSRSNATNQTLQGTITKESISGIFTLSGTFKLVKE